MTRPRPTVPRGFTLIELLVALGISSIVIGGGVALMLSQQRMFKSSSGDRAVQEMARVTLGQLSSTIQQAGFGVDPTVALDFGPTAQANMPEVPGAAGVLPRNNPGYRCDAGVVVCRDSTAGPDEIVFYARDPMFRHDLLGIAGTSGITISGPLNTPIYPGQVLQLMCTRKMKWAYVTVDKFVAANSKPDPISIALRAPTGQALDFPAQNAVMSSLCTGQGSAMVTKVDRYRYYIGTFDDLANPVPWQTPRAHPALMLDQGLLDENGQAITTTIAPDVEDLQFAYLFPQGGAKLVGATALLPIAVGPNGIDPGAASAGYDIASDGTPSMVSSIVRADQHPGNIRGVRVAIVVRTRSSELSSADATTSTIPASLNRDAMPGEAGYVRARFETTIFLPNMDARYPYFPMVSTTVPPGTDNLNLGGG